MYDIPIHPWCILQGVTVVVEGTPPCRMHTACVWRVSQGGNSRGRFCGLKHWVRVLTLQRDMYTYIYTRCINIPLSGKKVIFIRIYTHGVLISLCTGCACSHSPPCKTRHMIYSVHPTRSPPLGPENTHPRPKSHTPQTPQAGSSCRCSGVNPQVTPSRACAWCLLTAAAQLHGPCCVGHLRVRRTCSGRHPFRPAACCISTG